MNKQHVKTGDTVYVVSGEDKGKRGKITATAPAERKVMVEGVNIVTKHIKPRRQGQQGGLIKTEGAIYSSKVMIVCPKCNKPTRTGSVIMEDGKKVRICKRKDCQETF